MDPFINKVQHINTVEDAIKELEAQTTLTPKLKDLIDFIIEAHQGQYRKSGEPYEKQKTRKTEKNENKKTRR